jgi:hypothetical protein
VRILYAAGNRVGSREQLKRVISSIDGNSHELRISAYSKSMGSLDIDYNLDCLLNFTNQDGNITFNNNYLFYFNELKRYSPDLIISDLEAYTSIIGLEMSKEVWQVSPVLLYTGTNQGTKYSNNIRKNHATVINRIFTKKPYINFIINNSDKRFVYSHLCDIEKSPELLSNYEWIRPDFNLYGAAKGEAISINNGSEIQLSDAFYNEEFSFSKIDHKDIESIVCAHYNEQFELGKIITKDIHYNKEQIDIKINDGVGFLADKL